MTLSLSAKDAVEASRVRMASATRSTNTGRDGLCMRHIMAERQIRERVSGRGRSARRAKTAGFFQWEVRYPLPVPGARAANGPGNLAHSPDCRTPFAANQQPVSGGLTARRSANASGRIAPVAARGRNAVTHENLRRPPSAEWVRLPVGPATANAATRHAVFEARRRFRENESFRRTAHPLQPSPGRPRRKAQ